MRAHTLGPALALLFATSSAWPAAESPAGGDGPYAIAAVGRTVYGIDCWATPVDCEGGRANTRKLVLGWHLSDWAVEWTALDYGRATNPPSLAPEVGDTIRLQATGVGLAGRFGVGPSTRLLVRLGVQRTRHEVSRAVVMRSWSPTVGLGLLWQAMPVLGLELAWDVTAGDGHDSGTGVANAFTLGLRVGF